MNAFCLYINCGTIVFILSIGGTLSLKCYVENVQAPNSGTNCDPTFRSPVCTKTVSYLEGRAVSVQKACGMASSELRCINYTLPAPGTVQEVCACSSNWCNSATTERASRAIGGGLVILAVYCLNTLA